MSNSFPCRPLTSSFICIVILYILLGPCVDSNPDKALYGDIKTTNTWQAFKALLKTQRKAQMEAIKALLTMNNNVKQHDMLNLMTKKILEVLRESRTKLTAAKFDPKDDFPEDETVRDDLSKLIQNTLLFGDMALRFPAFIHRVYDTDSAIKDVIKWSFEFVSETRVTVGTNAAHTIPMASQELFIKERDEDFVNPFTQDEEMKLSDLVKDEMKKNKVKLKKKTGPRLSGGRKTEL